MRSSRATFSKRRGIALLVTLLMLTALSLIIAQVQDATVVAYKQARSRVYVCQCRRALDSVPGMAMRMLEEKGVDLAVDTLGDEWNWGKVLEFNVGDDAAPEIVRVTIEIEDCERRFDLKLLLEENPDLLERNVERFVAFAEGCGLSGGVAADLAQAIVDEAALRRTEDAVFVDKPPPPETSQPQPPGTPPPAPQRQKELVPLWLDDFLREPKLSDEKAFAVLSAYIERDDPTTQEVDVARVRFLDQVTVWGDARPNVNTASREVLLYGVPSLVGKEQAVDEILKYRAEKAIRNLSQLGTVAGLSREEVPRLSKELRLNSSRFRVTAVASYRAYSSRMTAIIERAATGKLSTLWRRIEP